MDNTDLEALLQQIRAKRGYLLPHHGLMAVASPDLLDAYDALYSTIALTEHSLSRHDHEFVWMGVLIATDEILGTHHIKRFRDAGGTDAELATAMQLTAVAKGARACNFVDDHWLPHLPGFDAQASYIDAFRKLAGDTPPALAQMLGAAVQTCLANWTALRWHIIAAYEDGVDEAELAEALSVAMFPGSVPHFVDAAGVWRELIVEGAVKASPAFQTWAELSGQGGFDEASGVKPAHKS